LDTPLVHVPRPRRRIALGILANELEIPTIALVIGHKYSVPGVVVEGADGIKRSLEIGRERFDRLLRHLVDTLQPVAFGNRIHRLGRSDQAALAQRAVALGQRFLAPGHCLVMGDLWPRSVLIDDERLHVIDWELAHAGNPAQDIGHLAAHLWMHAQCAASTGRAHQIDLVFERFVSTYRTALADFRMTSLVTEQTLRDADAHAGCEILARVIGPFRVGYLYEKLDPSHASVRRAIEFSCDLLLGVDTLFAR